MSDGEYRKETFSTDADDPAASWHDYLRRRQGSVGLGFLTEDFGSTAFAQNVGRFQLVEFTSAALNYQRSRRDVRDDGDNSYRLLLPLRGQFRFEQGEARAVFRPGSACFFHWGRPIRMTHDDTITALIMTVPEHSLDRSRAAAAPLLLDERRPLVHALAAQVRLLVEAEGCPPHCPSTWIGSPSRKAFPAPADSVKPTESTTGRPPPACARNCSAGANHDDDAAGAGVQIRAAPAGPRPGWWRRPPRR
ncbi:hypothetical protein [Nocardia blacklockiae]|uniref:AraC-like ligand-binding domain-containing protein n=1 Tax=Nocardia blacklockiae TaxID=480036 RepID=UPI0018936156|nr:hypothetical protein [Nocardia blacklockiae]MBF6169892.1 hypothetical protein [Nocardia blacklockiae]